MKQPIKFNPNGDTRTAINTSYEAFHAANVSHIEDVELAMLEIMLRFKARSKRHDWTKLSEEKQFYADYLDTINNGADFSKSKWANLHYTTERHHLSRRCPEDVNLIDVIEMICDCVCAGLARSGEVRPLEISPEILQKAVSGTVKLIIDNIEVTE